MAYNEMREIQGCRSWKKWQNIQMRKSYAENLKVQFVNTGKCSTHYMEFTYAENTESVTIRSAVNTITMRIAEFLPIMMELFMAEVSANMPLLEPVFPRKTVVRHPHTLPDYGPHVQTMAEKYAERLRSDRWDVRRNEDPAEWRLVRV